MKTAGCHIYRARALFSGSGLGRARPRPGWRAARAFEIVLVASALAGAMALAGGSAAQAAVTITYLSQFGAQGTGPGQFESPAAVAVNTATGDVYVTDITNDVVEEFNASGSYLSEFGGPATFPPPNGHFDQPIAIAADPGSGDVYVLDYNGNARIQEFDASGNFQLSWTLPEFQANQLAVDPATGDVYVTDTANDQVIKFGPSGGEISSFGNPGNPGTGSGQFTEPTTIAVDPSDGSLYVTDTTFACRTQKFDSSGTFQFQFGGCGSGDGQFNPGGVGGNGGEIYGPTGLAVDPATGDVYAVDGGNNRVELFDSSGDFVSAFGWGVADGASQFETCTASCQAGISGTGNGQLNNPDGDALNPATGELYVVDNGNDRVQVFGTAQVITPTTTTVSSSANPSVSGQQVTYTAVVSPVPSSGTVAFSDNGQPTTSCASQPVNPSTGNATCTITYPGPGSHQIIASFTSRAAFGNSVSPAISQTVNQDTTTTKLTAIRTPGVCAPSAKFTLTLTATVVPNAPGSGIPTGTVQFSEHTHVKPITLGGPVAVTGGVAQYVITGKCSGSPLPVTVTITANYSGGSSFRPSSGTASFTFPRLSRRQHSTVMGRPKQHGVRGLHIHTEHAVPRTLEHAAFRVIRAWSAVMPAAAGAQPPPWPRAGPERTRRRSGIAGPPVRAGLAGNRRDLEFQKRPP